MSSSAPPNLETAPVDPGDDAVAMQRVAAGDAAAMRTLVARWQQPLLGFFRRLVGSAATAEDLAVEVFVRVHRAAPGYAPTARFSTYLFAIAHRLALNELRRRRRKPAEPVPPDAFDHLAAGPETGRRLAELEEVFQIALAQLAPKARNALLMIAQQGLTYEEAAVALRSNPNAVRVLVHRARQELKTPHGGTVMKRPVTDEELDRLLAARLRHQSAEFAERVAARIEAARSGERLRRAGRWVWYLLPALAAAGFALVFAPRHETVAEADFETLLALDESLAPARPLLDPLNRELCRELPVAPSQD